MTKSRAPGSESNSTRKKKFKPSADDVTGVENMRTEMNGKTKKKRKTDDEKSQVCEYAQNIAEENVQMMQSTDTTNTEKRKHKNKKRKTEIPQDAEQIEDTTLTQEEEDHTEKKKKKKKKHKDCAVIVPEADVLKPQEAKHKTQTSEESADKSKKKHRKADISGDLENSPLTQEVCEDGSDEEEDLSPEERRVLERKLKKIRKKEEKTKLREEGKSTKIEKIKTQRAEKQALEYLTCWSERRDQWKFQKTRQTWLLQHMYDSVKVPDSYFEVLLSYLKGLRGAARETSLQKAEALVRWEGQEEEEDATDSEKKKQRAKLVMQML